MKLVKLLPVFLLSHLISENVQSQDTSIVNYFPMNVGNIWVYYCQASNPSCFCEKYFRQKVISSITMNNKRYFLFEYAQLIVSCNSNSGCGNLYITLDTVRIDSVSGNVMKYSQMGCSYSPNEIMQD